MQVTTETQSEYHTGGDPIETSTNNCEMPTETAESTYRRQAAGQSLCGAKLGAEALFTQVTEMVQSNRSGGPAEKR